MLENLVKSFFIYIKNVVIVIHNSQSYFIWLLSDELSTMVVIVTKEEGCHGQILGSLGWFL